MKRVVLACVGIAALGGVAAAADLPPAPAAPYYKAPALRAARLHVERILYRHQRRRRLGQIVVDDDQAASIRPAASSAARSATITKWIRRCSASKATSIGPTSTAPPARGLSDGQLQNQRQLAFDGARTARLRRRPLHAVCDRRSRRRRYQSLASRLRRRQRNQCRLDRGRRHRVRHRRPLDGQGRIPLRRSRPFQLRHRLRRRRRRTYRSRPTCSAAASITASDRASRRRTNKTPGLAPWGFCLTQA